MRGCAFVLALPLLLFGMAIGILGNSDEKSGGSLFILLAFVLALVAFGAFSGASGKEGAQETPEPSPALPPTAAAAAPEPPAPELPEQRERKQLRKDRIAFAIGMVLLALGFYSGLATGNWIRAGVAMALGALFIASSLGISRRPRR
jgi:hypothetical protein